MENRNYIYKKIYDSYDTYKIVRFKTINGEDYNQDRDIPETDADYQNYIAEDLEVEIVAYEFPDLEELKKAKIASLHKETTQAIYDTKFELEGHPKSGKPFDDFNQNNTALGVSGFDEDFRYHLNKCIKENLALLETKLALVNALEWNEEASDEDKQAKIDGLNSIQLNK